MSDATWCLVSGAFTGHPKGAIELRGRGRMEAWIIDVDRNEAGRWVPAGATPSHGDPWPVGQTPGGVIDVRVGVDGMAAPGPAILSRGAAMAPPTTGRGRVVNRSGVAQW